MGRSGKLVKLVTINLICAVLCLGACSNAGDLKSSRHLSLDVQIDTNNQQLRTQFVRALNFWQSILDMNWREVSDLDYCTIRVSDEEPFDSFDKDAQAFSVVEQGLINFDPSLKLSPLAYYMISIHELGHLFGLPHNPDPDSVMHANGIQKDYVLDGRDMIDLEKHHALRVKLQWTH